MQLHKLALSAMQRQQKKAHPLLPTLAGHVGLQVSLSNGLHVDQPMVSIPPAGDDGT